MTTAVIDLLVGRFSASTKIKLKL